MKRPAEVLRDRKTRSMRSFLTRLARDARGNTLAIVGAALLPLTAMIGGGVDMSRAYMAKTRLQAACDAGALAGRRVMVGDTLNQTVIDEARRFFNFNFPQGQYDTTGFTPQVTKPSSGVVQVTASTRVPTVIMKVFGFDTLPLNVTCDASLNFVNTDVVLVLDVTGSMAWDVNGNSTWNTADKRITALKEAVMALYDALAPVQAQLQSNGLRLRYGIVPYSSTVNVGGLIRGVNPDYIASTAAYQSRIYEYDEEELVGTSTPPTDPVEEVYNNGDDISQNDCDKYGRNRSFGSFNPSQTVFGGPPPATTTVRTYRNDDGKGDDWGYPGAPDTSSNKRSCRRWYSDVTTTYETRYEFEDDRFVEENIDVSQFKLGNPVAIASNTQGTVAERGNYDPLELAANGTGVGTTYSTWNGCIIERETVSTITSASGLTAPSDAYDLDINLIPDSDATRWKPMWPEITYRRSAGYTSASSGTSMSGSACPAAARRLDVWTRDALQTYVNGLDPVGSTYHDIGMIWGARLISTAGIFADACETYNAMPCTRHIIFMTDGQMDTDNAIYQAYGIEQNDMRVSGVSNADENNRNSRHTQRFKMACQSAKTMGTSIWVIAFGTSLTTALTECASNANQASTSTNKAALIAKFTEIGNNIGALRLTQ
ncbi:pilus assembly protein [Sphingosinicella rhizophila]|uniref:Pilus assembly protein n=1 Tax=Sphingosinicella rhizophila TaxID=3050082 RepID=A0ABU3Q793_9SPHN|nr:pilus assembly protein [Sphingosinicella sp. GR2756]MDT9599265.1 pilus assembly protein [Sphingosinicella sp. GR2756]